MGGTAISAVLGFAFMVVVARFYSVADVGLAGALVAAMGLVAAFSNLGLPVGAIRFLPLVEDKQALINSCSVAVGACSILASGIFISSIPYVSALMNWSEDLTFIRQDAVLVIGFILFAFFTVLLRLQQNVFIGSRRAEFSSAAQVGTATLKIPLVIVLVSLGAFGIFSSWGVATAVMFVAGIFFLRKVLPGYRPSFTFKRKIINQMFRFSFVNYVSELMGNAPMYILPLMVLGTLGAEQNAYYYIAYGAVGALGIIPAAFIQSLFAEGSTEPKAIRSTSIRAMKLMALIMVPALLVVFFVGDKILLAFGAQYSENSFVLLWILSIALIPHAINEIYMTICMVRFKLRSILFVNLARAVLIPLLTYLLMAKFGLLGVGWGYLAAVGGISLVTTWLLRRELRREEIASEKLGE